MSSAGSCYTERGTVRTIGGNGHMAGGPEEISIDAFRQAWTLEGEDFWRSVFDMHKDKMQVKTRESPS